VFLNVTSDRGIPPSIESSSYLTLKGKMDEAVRDTADIEFHVHRDDRTEPGPARPASVGAIIQTRPHVSVVVSIPTGEFDRLWLLAATGHLRHGHFAFTKPRYNSAKVVSVGWSNGPIE
jgi:hypothetical protein